MDRPAGGVAGFSEAGRHFSLMALVFALACAWRHGNYVGSMMLIETQVRPSGIHGMGLFAAQWVPRGTPIWRFEPGFDHDFSPAQFAALPLGAQKHTRWFCFVSRDNGHVILSGDHACFINHSPTPNTGALPDAAPPVVTVALRDIAAGEEITCNYFHYDADTPWKLGLVPADAPLGAQG